MYEKSIALYENDNNYRSVMVEAGEKSEAIQNCHSAIPSLVKSIRLAATDTVPLQRKHSVTQVLRNIQGGIPVLTRVEGGIEEVFVNKAVED